MEKQIQVEWLSNDAFKDYGKVIDLPDYAPPKTGEGWVCWNYIAMMDVSEPIGMGLVITKDRELQIHSMERHVSREELLIPFDREIIQPVARCMDLQDPEEQPNPKTVRCFRIKPGQGIILNKGVWHSPAYPVAKEATYLFAIEKKPDAFGDEMINPWVTFQEEVVISMRL